MKETDVKKPNDFSDIEEEFNQKCYKFYKQRHRDNMCKVVEEFNSSREPIHYANNC